MTCGVRTPRRRAALKSGGLEKVDDTSGQAGQTEVFGTWDFAWPLGTTIRVAFQSLPSGNSAVLDSAIEKFMRRVNDWRKVLEKAGAEIDFEVHNDWILDPPLGEDRSQTDRNRSSFDPEEATAKSYDVLVSFADLPVVDVDPLSVDRRSPDGLTKRLIRLPYSELGSYARRVDYGSPTMYIGRFGRFIAQQVPIDQYIDSPIGRHVVLHELGHALGLAHSHQNPLWSREARRYRPAKEIAEIMAGTLGLDFKPAFGVETDADREAEELVNGHIVHEWRGNPEFSYWQKPDDPNAIAGLDSVMKVPFHDCFLVGHKPCSNCAPEGRESASFAGIVTQPTPLEEKDLRQIYSGRASPPKSEEAKELAKR